MRLIDIEKRMEEWNELCKAYFPNVPCQTLYQFLLNAPTIEAEPVRHGVWRKPTVIEYRMLNIPHCSVCKSVPCGVDENTKYCPNCGARMDGDPK